MAITIRFCGGKYSGCADQVERLDLVHTFFDTARQRAIVYVRDQDSLNYYYDKERSESYTKDFAVAYAKTQIMAQATARATARKLAKRKT